MQLSITAFFIAASCFCVLAQRPTGEAKKAQASGQKQTVKNTVKVALPKIKVVNTKCTLFSLDEDRSVATPEFTYPSKLTQALELTDNMRLKLAFNIQDDAGKNVGVDIALLRFHHKASGKNVYAIAEADKDSLYTIDLSLHETKSDFQSVNGEYSLILKVGSTNVANEISWVLADSKITFTNGVDAAPSNIKPDFQPKPEIKHMFREPEARPPAILTTIFFVGVVSLIGVLLVGWSVAGANLYNLPFGLPTLLFFGSLAGVFYLYWSFWIRLNMFQTIGYLAGLSLLLLMSGNSMLRSVANKRVASQ